MYLVFRTIVDLRHARGLEPVAAPVDLPVASLPASAPPPVDPAPPPARATTSSGNGLGSIRAGAEIVPGSTLAGLAGPIVDPVAGRKRRPDLRRLARKGR